MAVKSAPPDRADDAFPAHASVHRALLTANRNREVMPVS